MWRVYMENNINLFQSAYFGKPYRTRDGRKARFVINMGEHYGHPYRLVIEGEYNFFNYDEHGMMLNIERGFDIVSEWQEEINEEELDELADAETCRESDEFNTYLDDILSLLDGYKQLKLIYRKGLMWAFKTGCRKTLEYINRNKK